MTQTRRQPHPMCVLLRNLREATGISLSRFEEIHGFPSVVLGAYERGDRLPPLYKLEALLGFYGYRLEAVPIHTGAVRPVEDQVAVLRAIADQLEAQHDVSGLSSTAA